MNTQAQVAQPAAYQSPTEKLKAWVDGPVLHLSFNNPAKHNAISVDMWEAVPVMLDLLGFWLAWHLEGGFEGLQRMGMSRASIYRRISLFRRSLGVHPDEYMPAGITLDIAAYQASKPEV